MGVTLRDQKVHWVYRLGESRPATLSVDEDIGEQFATVSIDRWVAGPPVLHTPTRRGPLLTSPSTHRILQYGHMSVTVEKQMIHETKGDTVAPGDQGLLNLQPDDFVFYVGGYPSNFTVSPGLCSRHGGSCSVSGCGPSCCTEHPDLGPSRAGGALTVPCAHSPPSPSAFPATLAALR